MSNIEDRLDDMQKAIEEKFKIIDDRLDDMEELILELSKILSEQILRKENKKEFLILDKEEIKEQLSLWFNVDIQTINNNWDEIKQIIYNSDEVFDLNPKENPIKPILKIAYRIRDLNKKLTRLLEASPDEDDTYNLPESMKYKGN